MRDSMVLRGPDDAGHYMAAGIALGCRRLSIQDLSPRGSMPMSSLDQNYWIVHNGEIYNFRALRRDLESKGCVFRSDTDTEVLLHLFQAEGPRMLPRLNGMFAFAIWDARARSLFMARDRLGIKPLYYTVHQGALYFASTVRALFAAGVPCGFDETTLGELLCFRYVAGTRTPYHGIKRLLPGHSLLWRHGKITTTRWWSLSEAVSKDGIATPADARAWFRETLDDAVRLRMPSDVPVGVLLSGGLDSGSIAASLGLLQPGVVPAFTVRFPDGKYDEGERARLVAERSLLRFYDLPFAPRDVTGYLWEAARLSDEPSPQSDDSYFLAISRYAKRTVSVVLSGEGGDETLGGYVRYQPLRFLSLLHAARVGLSAMPTIRSSNRRLRKLRRLLAFPRPAQWVLFSACDVLPQDLRALGFCDESGFPYRESIVEDAERTYPKDLARQAMFSDEHTFLSALLQRSDQMTMAASLECRFPFLDFRLVEGIARLPSALIFKYGSGKHLLRSSIGHRLPGAVLRHRKWGFAAPWSSYLREIPELRALIEGLSDAPPFDAGPLDRRKLQDAIRSFNQGDPENEDLIRQLVMIRIWFETSITVKRSTTHRTEGREAEV